MTHRTMPHPAASTRVQLAREWSRLRSRPPAIELAARWAITDTPPTSLDDVLVAVGAGGDRSAGADERLRRLVGIAHRDELAARVVIERLLPGLLSLSSKYRPAPEAFEELLAAAWIAVRTYNPGRRPSNIAVALLSDAEYAAFRRGFRRREHVAPPVELPEQLSADGLVHPADELAEILDVARSAGMRDDDVELVRMLVVTPSPEDVARHLQVTSRTIRNRRQRAVASLRELVLTQ